MNRTSSRLTAGVNSRYSSNEYVLASFMKGQKHAVIPMTSININPINTDKAAIKICGDTTPLTIIAKGSKAQMNMNKTKFARETGSEEIDLGQFVDDEEEKENDLYDDFDKSTSFVQTSPIPQPLTNSKENSINKPSESYSTNKPSESYSSTRSSITYTTKDKSNIDFDTVFNTSSTSKKRHHDFDSSLDGSDDNDEDAAPRTVSSKRTDINDSSKMLNKLLNRKKAPAKKKKKTTAITDDSIDVECESCNVLREQMNTFVKRLERVERVIPAIGLETTTTTTTTSMPKIEQINQSIKDIFGVEAAEVKGPRERPTIIIRSLFTVSNHVSDYRQYLEKYADLLKDFVQYRCPGIINIEQTWHEIVKSMSSLANDIKKNLKTKLARQMANTPNTRQLSITTISANDMTMTPDDNVETEVIV